MPDVTVSNDIDTFMQSADKAAARTALGATATGQAAITAADAAALRDAGGASGGVYPGSTVAAATESAAGVVEFATRAETIAGAASDRSVHPDGIKYMRALATGYELRFGSSSYWSYSATTGDGSIFYDPHSLSVRTGSTAGSTAYAGTRHHYLISSNHFGNQVSFDWSTEFFVSLAISPGQGSGNAIRRVSLGKIGDAAIGDLATAGVQVIFDGFGGAGTTDLIIQTHDGTTLSNTTPVAVDFSGYYIQPLIIHNHGDGNVDVYWGDAAYDLSTPTVSSATGPDTNSVSSNSNETLRIEVDNTIDAGDNRFTLEAGRITAIS